MSDKTRKIAVLTGDLVNSTGLGPGKVERAFVALEDCKKEIEGWPVYDVHFSRHRGDGWQLAFAMPKYAFRAALLIRAELKALGEEFDTYIAIADGEYEGILGNDLNEETGPIFVHSGSVLEKIKTFEASTRMAYAKTGNPDAGSLNAVAILLDNISQNWTQSQAQTISRFLDTEGYDTITGVANILGKSRQAVSKSLAASKEDIIRLALQSIEHGPLYA